MLISPAYAQAAAAPGGDMFVSILPLVLIFVVFYFLLIRPQQAKAKQQRQLIDNLKKGDQVLTSGGIIGKVTRVEDEKTIMVEIAQGVVVKVARATISDIVNKPVPANTSNDNAAKTGQKTAGGLFGRLFKK
ncbi:protein translocase subunit yajC [Arboricoccus pini]|uniref:Sec translocon accessory complex subunit YajC n=1 Tax=Arboricoccus pini TaxID=1963835 RepID=A0A212QQ05_9PROT|nr:preprotein translocase subunit YajC [Arboricoccus pini]SNB61507.1 protein translocase subunit yajC [Arboricoccus pini]